MKKNVLKKMFAISLMTVCAATFFSACKKDDDIDTGAGSVMEAEEQPTETAISEDLTLKEGTYEVDVEVKGGTGRAEVASPAKLIVEGDVVLAEITWSSEYYDYMIVDEEKYEPINESGNSVFEIPVDYFDEEIKVIADTTKMSEPHEIEYTFKFDSSSIK